jgi:predicted phage terminase large subunit-like protein
MLVVSRVAARLYLLDYLTGRWDFPEQLRRLEAAIARYRPIAVRVEAAASGHSVVQTLRARLPYVTGVVPHGPKDVRLSAVTPMLEAGSVLFPAGAPWVRAFRDEVLAFPRGAHDECVDTLSMACGLLARPGLDSPDLGATVDNLISLLG